MGGGCCIGDCCIFDCGFCCIMDFGGCGDCCVSDTPVKTLGRTKEAEVADELEAMRARAKKMALEEENNVIEQIGASIVNFLKILEECNSAIYGGRKLNINIDGIREKNKKLEEEVRGFIGRRMEDRLVQTDKELSVILHENDKSIRKKNFEDFYQRVMRDALLALDERISQTVNEQREMVENAIKQRLDEVNAGMERIEREYKILLKKHEANSVDVSLLQLDYMYRLDVCEIMLDRIEATKKIIASTHLHP